MPKFKVGDVIIRKDDLFIRRVIDVDGLDYVFLRTLGRYKGTKLYMKFSYIENRYKLHTKKVKATNISRTFYKGKIESEIDGILTVRLYEKTGI